eukprot:jgi/Mesen1/918/ME000117S00084
MAGRFEVKVMPYESKPVTRDMFPKDFTFGASTAAYQVEGAANEDGKGKSIWDVFAAVPGHVKNDDNGDVACDQYHRYKEDVQVLKKLGMDAYRFSLCWPRILPEGRGKINQAGVDYYNNLINELIANGLEPWVTLFHWDLPQCLHEEYNGWLSDKVVADYVEFAETCFELFGDRVKHWITFNEPYIFSSMGYGIGATAPGIHDPPNGPYIVGHNILKSHAAAVHLYRTKYQAKNPGAKIGLTIDANWAEPASDSPADVAAADRANQFHLSWMWDPIFKGDYPPAMRKNVANRLPKFTDAEKALLKNSADFIGINHYTTKWITAGEAPRDKADTDFVRDQHVIYSAFKDDVAIGIPGASFWHYVVPWGMKKLLLWLYNRYQVPVIVTECGVDEHDAPEKSIDEKLNDGFRVQFHNDYIYNVAEAIKEGADVKGYFVWSLLDNYEWNMGYSLRFGITYVDYEDDLKRHIKASGKWFSKFNEKKPADWQAW